MLSARIVMTLLGLTMLLQLLEMLDDAGTLVAAGAGAGGMLTYAAWRLPLMAVQVMPIAVLIGTLVTWLGLAGANELVAMRSAGVTGWRILGSVLPVALAASALQFALADQVAPRLAPAFADWWRTIEAKADAAKGKAPPEADDGRVWMRAGPMLIAVGSVDRVQRRMADLTFVMLDDEGRIERRLDASAAAFEDGRWRLLGVRDVSVGAARPTVKVLGTAAWPAAVPAEAVMRAFDPPIYLSVAHLAAVLNHTAPAWFGDVHYRARLHHQFASTLAAPLMILLAMPAAFGATRLGGSGHGFILGFLLGLGYVVVDGMLFSMGRAGLLPAVMAAWTAPATFACLGVALLLKLEDP